MLIEEAKELIKQTALSQIISQYLSIQKKGAHFMALCPFHQDTNPSLTINDSKGLFMCFACQTGGDAITFVEKYKNLNFKDAIIELAQILDISIELQPQKANPKFDMAKKLLNVTNKLYRKYALDGNSDIFTKFLESRNIKEEMNKKLSLGYSPPHHILAHYLETLPSEQKEMAKNVALEIGLIRRNTKASGHYDTFYKRIIFPIWDQYDQVIGFGGRATSDGQKGKYINSQDSLIFNKKNVLYGLNFAKHLIRERNRAILVEGYMDLLSLHSHGFEESVAVMGVAISVKNVKLLKAMTKNIYLALDSDGPGMEAMKKINQLFMQNQILPKYLDFSPYKDPDEYCSQKGHLSMAQLIEEAPTFIDHQIKLALPENIPNSTDTKLEHLYKIFTLLAPLRDELSACERVIKVAKTLGLKSDSERIVQTYKNYLNSEKRPLTRSSVHNEQKNRPHLLQSEENHLKTEGSGPQKEETRALSHAHKYLLQEAITHPQCLSHPLFAQLLDFISHKAVKKIVLWLKDLYYEIEESQYSTIIRNFLTKEDISLEIRELAGRALYRFQGNQLDPKVQEKLLLDIKRKLEVEKLRLERNELRKQQRACDADEEANEIMKKISAIEKQLNQLKNQVIHKQL